MAIGISGDFEAKSYAFYDMCITQSINQILSLKKFKEDGRLLLIKDAEALDYRGLPTHYLESNAYYLATEQFGILEDFSQTTWEILGLSLVYHGLVDVEDSINNGMVKGVLVFNSIIQGALDRAYKQLQNIDIYDC